MRTLLIWTYLHSSVPLVTIIQWRVQHGRFVDRMQYSAIRLSWTECVETGEFCGRMGVHWDDICKVIRMTRNNSTCNIKRKWRRNVIDVRFGRPLICWVNEQLTHFIRDNRRNYETASEMSIRRRKLRCKHGQSKKWYHLLESGNLWTFWLHALKGRGIM
jgi:hypothetical protein